MKLKKSQIRNLILEEVKYILENKVFSKGVQVNIDEKLDRCTQNESLITEFSEFCADKLGINELIIIKIVNNRSKDGLRTTADYSPDDHLIRVYGKNRAIVDICRSIAHEMTHMHQMINGKLKFPVQDVGGEIEDEANAKAGEIIKLFAKSLPSRKAIYERKKYFK